MGEGHDAGRVGVDRIGRLLPAHSALRPVVVSIGLTALVMWVLTHMGTMAPTSVVQMSPGTPLPAVSAGSGGISSSSVPGVATLAAAASSVPRTIVVQVIGEVHEPGLVTLPDGARVADAIEAAGGLISRRSSGGLNVARRLVDGEQIVVSHADPTSTPVAQVVGPSTSIPGVGAPIDLNSADVAALDGLPGVGPVMAARIIAWRTQHGRFTSVDQLRDVSGIGQRTFERLRPFVRI
jgi:competence protein ComEA